MPRAPTRPVVRWHGGKWRLAPWIIEHMPPHRVYVEPFGGGGSVLLRKPRAYAEIWNDLDGDIVNLFRVLRSERAPELLHALELTPFARDEFVEAYEQTDCPIERARRMIIRAFMGFGSNGHNRSTGFRANSSRSGTTPAHDWRSYPKALRMVIDRLSGVTIESRDARTVMAAHDSPATLHYVDPPYVFQTRSDLTKDYAHELTDADHGELLQFMTALKGRVILSGYPSAMYDSALPGWRRVEKQAFADGAAKRTEVLWLNFAADDLFGNAAAAREVA